jgi:hypothetical protein
MANSKKKTQKKPTKKASKKNDRPVRPAPAKKPTAQSVNLSLGNPFASKVPSPIQPAPPHDHRAPSIDVRRIDGETTIGDLIVAFPRTRDVLMKHGLRFDVEEAGYLYMTLSVFSAIHGHSTSSLVEQLVVASKEPPPLPPPQPIRPIVATPTS